MLHTAESLALTQRALVNFLPMHRDTKGGKGSRRDSNIQHPRERNGRDSLRGPWPPENRRKGAPTALFWKVQENCWSGGLKLVCPPPRMIAVSSTKQTLAPLQQMHFWPSITSQFHRELAQGTRAASLQIFNSALTQGGEGWNCREMISAQMKCWGMEVSMQNLAPSQTTCEEERGFSSILNATKCICPSHLLYFHLGMPVMFSPTSSSA